MTIKLIVGIGNIGSKYINTRHNFGKTYVQLLAETYNIFLKRNDMLHGYLGKLKIKNISTCLLIPNSYINNCGLSISKCVNFYQLSSQEILVAHDECDLPPGTVRIKLGKRMYTSHRGIKDIIDKLNSFDFYRLRIGIGKPKNKNQIIDFVLNQPSTNEKDKIYNAINKAIVYTEDIICNNFIKVMNKLHTH